MYIFSSLLQVLYKIKSLESRICLFRSSVLFSPFHSYLDSSSVKYYACTALLICFVRAGNSPRRVCGPEPDSRRVPALCAARYRLVRYGGTMHHVCLCAAPVPHPSRLLWLPQRPLWWMRWSHESLRRVSLERCVPFSLLYISELTVGLLQSRCRPTL